MTFAEGIGSGGRHRDTATVGVEEIDKPTDTNLCLLEHDDCAADPTGFASHDVAVLVYRAHAGHSPHCLQGLAAGAFLSESNQD